MILRRMRGPLRSTFGAILATTCALVAGGCGLMDRHEERRVPQLGVIDPMQPGELRKVTLPPYVVEPPDELEIDVRPAAFDITRSIVRVQADGNINLGFEGNVYVAGLTLYEIELKIAQHLTQLAQLRETELRQPIEVSARLASETRSKYYYVIGTVSTQGQFPVNGGETVLQAILLAGLRSHSLPEKSYLVRPQPPGVPDTILRIDWVGITQRGDTTTNYQVMPGDRIYVPGGRPPGLLTTLFGG